MLAQRLLEYARGSSDHKPFHRERAFRWRLELPRSGRAPELFRANADDPNGRGERRVVPAVTRTVGIAPQLGADDVQYVLGWGDETTKPGRVQKCHDAFVQLVNDWAEAAAPECPEAAVVRDFYSRKGVDELTPKEGMTAKQGVLITVDDQPIVDLPALQQFWINEVTRRKAGSNTGLCLVCGQIEPLADTVPGTVAQRLVPGAANDAALISINERVFGYGLRTSLEHTPICLSCGDAINAALTELLSGQHVMSLPQQSSAMTWWILGQTPSAIEALMPDTADPDAVNDLLDKFERGGPLLGAASLRTKATDGRFCSLTLGGNASRIMVRDWLEMPLSTLVDNLVNWYQQHQTVSPVGEGTTTYPVRGLVRALGRWDPKSSRYRDFSSRGSGRMATHEQDLLKAAIRGRPVPPAVLHHVLHRIRLDRRIDGPRAAIIRLALARLPGKETTMPTGLDPTRTDPAYVAGRLFAHYEHIQYTASGGKLNATVVDRHFAGAMSNPLPALNAASRSLPGWLARIRREKSGGLADHLKGELLKVADLLNDRRLPRRLGPTQQAEFSMGYYHQNSYDRTQRAKKPTSKNGD